MTAWLPTVADVQSLALRRHLRMQRIGQVAHYLAIIGVIALVCLVGLVVLAVIHRRRKPGPEG